MAGPWMTLPSTSNREPWQGQSQVRSRRLNPTVQPRCVQTADTAWISPASSLKQAVLPPSVSTTMPSPDANSAMRIREAPGLGIEIDEHKLAHYRTDN